MREDSGFLPDGTPWVRWNALNKTEPRSKRMDELSAGAIIKAAKYLAAYFDKRRAQAPMPAPMLAPLPLQMPTRASIGEQVIKANQNPVLSPNHYVEMQKRIAEASAIAVAEAKGVRVAPPNGGQQLYEKVSKLMKDRGWDMNRFDQAVTKTMREVAKAGIVPHVRHAQPTDKEIEEPWDKRVAGLMDKHKISEDAAITMLYRAEKERKWDPNRSAEHINDEPYPSEPMGAHVNPRPLSP
jgi:hypothetical protein